MKPRADSAVNRWQQRLKPVSPRLQSGGRVAQTSVERPRTVAEAADELGLSVYTVRAWIANRRLAHLRLGRTIRIPAAEVRRVIEASTVPANESE